MKCPMMKCPMHPIDIPEDREVCLVDEKQYEWKMDPKGYFLVKLDHGMICCGWVSSHKMLWELRGNDPCKLAREIANRAVCSAGNLAYIAQELMLAKDCLLSGNKYVQR